MAISVQVLLPDFLCSDWPYDGFVWVESGATNAFDAIGEAIETICTKHQVTADHVCPITVAFTSKENIDLAETYLG